MYSGHRKDLMKNFLQIMVPKIWSIGLILRNFFQISLRASLPKIDGKVAHVKFCFHKIHVSLDLGIKTEPTPPIKMGGHAPRGKIADPPISRVQNRNFTFLLLEPQDEEVLKK